MANRTRAQLSIDASTLFPNNTSQLISPQDLRDWLANGIDSFVTQKDKSALTDVLLESNSTSIVAGGTANLNLADGNFVHITGVTEINSFGDMQAGSRFVLVFDDAAQIRASSAIIIPGVTSGNLKTAIPGDCCMIISEGSGNWRIVGYFPGAGAGSGTVSSVSGTGTVNGITLTGTVTTTGNLTLGGTLSGVDLASQVTGILPIVNGGTGTTTPSLVAGSNVTISGSWPNQTINASGGGGGTPGGDPTEVQYNNSGSFDGIPELTYSGGFVQIETPKIGTGNGNGHFHIHSANSAPSGITDYLTMFWQKATRTLGFRSETDTHETYIALTAPTADRTITLPDATGNVLIDTVIPSLNNGTSAGEIRLREATASGSNYVAIKSPATLGADWSMTLPTTAGTSGYVLQTDGAGVTQWALNGGINPNKYIRSSVQASVTNVAVDTLIQSILIPAGTFTNGDSFIYNLTLFISGGGSTGSTTATSVRINSTPTIGGFIIINANNEGGGVVYPTYSQKIAINDISGTQTTTATTIASQTSGVLANTTINWAINQYIVVSGTVQTRTKTFLQLAITPL